jgi:FKBP-type peptidyl-prolyl cis-trans isomerase SlyD
MGSEDYMKIDKDRVVSIHYTLKDESGEVIDTSSGRDPLNYVHGASQIISGMEKALEGLKAGEEISVVVEPQQGYGERDESLVYEVPRDQFQGIEDIQVGMCFQVNSADGPLLMNVIDIEGESITLDGNHPLADMRLYFDISIVGVREATEEELASCQHAPGCEC